MDAWKDPLQPPKYQKEKRNKDSNYEYDSHEDSRNGSIVEEFYVYILV